MRTEKSKDVKYETLLESCKRDWDENGDELTQEVFGKFEKLIIKLIETHNTTKLNEYFEFIVNQNVNDEWIDTILNTEDKTLIQKTEVEIDSIVKQKKSLLKQLETLDSELTTHRDNTYTVKRTAITKSLTNDSGAIATDYINSILETEKEAPRKRSRF